MPTIRKAFFNWSGGKDSSFALFKLKEAGFQVEFLLTTLSEKYRRISQHGVREALLDQQAEALKIPLEKIYLSEYPSMEEYNNLMHETILKFKKRGITSAVFGDIFLEDLRKYREERLLRAGIKAVFPLWDYPTEKLIRDFLDSGFKTIITCVNERYLDKSFAGQEITKELLEKFPENVDPCGENGEFHTFVFDGPIFTTPVSFVKGEIIRRVYTPNTEDTDQTVPETGFWFCDLIPA